MKVIINKDFIELYLAKICKSQNWLGYKLMCGSGYISQIISGNRNVSPPMREKILEVFPELNFDDLFIIKDDTAYFKRKELNNLSHIRINRGVKALSKLYGEIEKNYNDKVYKKTNGRCAYCGNELKLKIDFTYDHIIPTKIDGANGENLYPACLACNQAKSDLTIEEFRKSCEKYFKTDKYVFYFEKLYGDTK